MKSIDIRRVVAIPADALLLSHCTQNPVWDGKTLVLMSEQREIQLGAKMYKEVLQEYTALDHPELQAYGNEVGRVSPGKVTVRSCNGISLWRDDPEINAFALPGGYVYTTHGIMAYLNSEAELADVLAHEIGHVTARRWVREPRRYHGTFATHPSNDERLKQVAREADRYIIPNGELRPGQILKVIQ